MAFSNNGILIGYGKAFEEDIVMVDLESEKKIDIVVQLREEKLYYALCLGLKDYFFKTGHKSHFTLMFIVFNLAQLSIIFTSFTDLGFLLAYLLKSLSLNILLMVATISKKPIFSFKNKPTRTSFDAFTIIGAEYPEFKHLLINFIDGKFFD